MATARKKRNPELTSEQILTAATQEFGERGFGGARVDNIAARAGANKRMIYHYYGNKKQLFLAVLEAAYAEIRSHERELDLDHLEPIEAVRKLVAYTFTYFLEHPEFIRLLNNENLYDAVHIKSSKKIPKMHSPLVGQIEGVLARGQEAGIFRNGVDPVQLYISVAAVGYFYLSNASTLGTIFGRDLKTKKALKERLDHIEGVILGYLRKE